MTVVQDYKLGSRIFKPQQPAVGAQGINSKDSRVTYRSVQEQLRRFSEYFAEVFSSEDINVNSSSTWSSLLQTCRKRCVVAVRNPMAAISAAVKVAAVAVKVAAVAAVIAVLTAAVVVVVVAQQRQQHVPPLSRRLRQP
jgi:hypothetical protein